MRFSKCNLPVGSCFIVRRAFSGEAEGVGNEDEEGSGGAGEGT